MQGVRWVWSRSLDRFVSKGSPVAQRRLSVAVLQPSLAWAEPSGNFQAIRDLVQSAGSTGRLNIVVLPEAFAGAPAEHDPAASRRARQFLAELARSSRAHVVGGTVGYQDSQGRHYNACFVVDRRGRQVGCYRKQRLFGAERQVRVAGRDPGLFVLDGLRVAVLICADLWFPELLRPIIDRADVLCVPAKTTVPARQNIAYARRLWHGLALTRAMENGLPVFVADWAQARHPPAPLDASLGRNRAHYTSAAACICDPGGRPDVARVHRTLPGGRPGVLVHPLDLDAVARFRDYRRRVGLLPET
jgi:predicted amidohydrolase